MQKYNKPKYNYNDLGINPCVSSLQIPVKEVLFKNQYKKDGDILIPVIQEAEDTAYCKMYATADRRKIISNLTPCGKELFLWLMFEIEYGRDALWINRERFCEENHTSLNTFKKAKEELIRYALIAYTVVKDVYWIHPDFFFKGDRVSKYPSNVVLRK